MCIFYNFVSVGYYSELEKGTGFYGFYNNRGQKNCIQNICHFLWCLSFS